MSVPAQLLAEAADKSYPEEGGNQPALGEGFSWYDEIEGDNGLHGQIWHNDETGEYIVAFTGTEFGEEDIQDFWTNANWGWPQFEALSDASGWPDFVAEAYGDPDATIHFTGHSLGGALAQFAAYEYLDPAQASTRNADITLTTFNALGGQAGIETNMDGYDATRVAGLNAKHYVSEQDGVSKLGNDHVGGVVQSIAIKPDSAYEFPRVIEAHDIKQFYAADENGNSLTEADYLSATPRDEYLDIDTAQAVMSIMGGINSDTVFDDSESLSRLVAGLMPALLIAPEEQLDDLLSTFLPDYANLETALDWVSYRNEAKLLFPGLETGVVSLGAVAWANAEIAQQIANDPSGDIQELQIAKGLMEYSFQYRELSEEHEVTLGDSILEKISDIGEYIFGIFDSEDPNIQVFGGVQPDQLYGNEHDNKIFGYEGDDTLWGLGGRDSIYAGDGNNIIQGGEGDDLITGGAGDDAYIYNPGDGRDLINDGQGNNRLIVDGRDLTGITLTAVGQEEGVYRELDANGDPVNEYTYIHTPGYLTIKLGSGNNDDVIRILTFNAETNNFGITFSNTGSEPLPVYDGEAIYNLNDHAVDEEYLGSGGENYLRFIAGAGYVDGDDEFYNYELDFNAEEWMSYRATSGGESWETFQFEGDRLWTMAHTGDFYYIGTYADLNYIGMDNDGIFQVDETVRSSIGDDYVNTRGGNDVLWDAVDWSGFQSEYIYQQDINSLLSFENDDIFNGGDGSDVIYSDPANHYSSPQWYPYHGEYRISASIDWRLALDLDENFIYQNVSQIYLTFIDGDDVVFGGEQNGIGDFVSTGGGDDIVTTGLASIENLVMTGHGADMVIGGDSVDRVFADSHHHEFGEPIGVDLSVPETHWKNILDNGIGGYSNYNHYYTAALMDQRYEAGHTYIEDGGLLNLQQFFEGIDYNDDIYGGSGNDFIAGEIDDDYISGGDGNDFLFGDRLNYIGAYQPIEQFAYADLRSEDHGKDIIEGGQGDDVIYGGGANDGLSGNDGSDTILGDDVGVDLEFHGNDEIHGGSGNDFLYGVAGKDTIYGDEGSDVIYGDVLPTLTFEHGDPLAGDYDSNYHDDDRLYGGAGHDLIFGDGGDDFLSGGDGHDSLEGGDGADILRGGRGDDYLSGGQGADTFEFSRGDGVDWIADADSSDTLKVSNIRSAFHFYETGSTVFLIYGETDAVAMSSASYYALDGVQVWSGEVSTPEDVVADIQAREAEEGSGGRPDYIVDENDASGALNGGIGNDFLSANAETNEVNGGEGNNVYTFSEAAEGIDALHGGAGQDRAFLSSSTDSFQLKQLVIADSIDEIHGNESVSTIAGDEQNNTLDFSSTRLFGLDLIDGRGGEDTIIGSADDNGIAGGQGSDMLSGGLGDDSYFFTTGDGADIVDNAQSTDGIDTLIFEGLSEADVTQTQVGDDLVLSYGNGDSVTVLNHYLSDDYAIDNIVYQSSSGNTAPAPVADAYQSAEDTPVVLTEAELLVNDTDPDGDSLSISTVGNAVNGTVTFDAETREITFTPNADYHGPASFDYTLSDGTETATGVVSIDVLPSSDPITGSGSGDTLTGTSANDIILGEGGNDTIYGGAGNDTLDGGTGRDELFGEAGDDTFLVDGDSGRDTVNGGAGNDLLLGGANDDTFRLNNFIGDNRVETIDGGAGNNIIQSGPWSNLDLSETTLLNIDTIQGGCKNNTIIGSSADDIIDGGAGRDTLSGGAGDDTFRVDGDSGRDTVNGGAGNDLLLGGDNDDTFRLNNFTGDNRVETIDGGAGTNTIQAGPWSGLDFSETTLLNIDTIQGGSKNNTIIGSSADDIINGGAGRDTLSGGDGDDTFLVDGDSGRDTVNGGAGNDLLLGGDNDDTFHLNTFTGDNRVETIDGGAGHNIIQAGPWSNLDFSGTTLLNIDTIQGGSKNNTIIGSSAADIIDGGAGRDTLSGGAGDDTFRVDGDSGRDTVNGGAGNDLLLGGDNDDTFRLNTFSGDNRVETIDGGAGTNIIQAGPWSNLDFSETTLLNIDTIQGGSKNNTIIGSSADDTIDGGAGRDTLSGDAGDDRLAGGSGTDTLYGSAGSDTFVMAAGSGQDTIRNHDDGNSDPADTDTLALNDITHDQLWFSRTGDDLVIDYVGTDDQVTVEDWYLGEDYQTDLLTTGADGYQLTATAVDQLVTAMAQFAIPEGVGAVIPQNQQDQLQPVLAASWMAA